MGDCLAYEEDRLLESEFLDSAFDDACAESDNPSLVYQSVTDGNRH